MRCDSLIFLFCFFLFLFFSFFHPYLLAQVIVCYVPGGGGAAISNACSLFDPIPNFKGGHLICVLGKMAEVSGGGKEKR